MATHPDDEPGRTFLRPIDEAECWALMATTTVGRLAFVTDEGQQLVPVNFTVVDGVVYLRTAPDTVIAQLADGHDDVAFGVDYHDDTYQRGWNVTVTGVTALADPPPDEASTPRPWAPGERDVVIRLTPSSIQGRKVRRR